MTVQQSDAAFPGPDEIEGFWAWDKMHAPRPLSPLASDLIIPGMAVGFTRAQAEFDSPIALDCKLVNYYLYAAFHPIADEAEAEDRLTRYRETLQRKILDVGRQWDEEWKPWLISTIAEERAIDYTTMSDAQILEALDRHVAHMTDQWTIHGRINFVLVATANFCDFYNEIVQPDDETEAYQALQGFHTRSVDASRGLWRLSRIVRDEPPLRELFRTCEPAQIAARLGDTPEGRRFDDELRRYLDEFGWRSDAVYDVADITWREEPSIPLSAVAAYVDLDDDADPEILFQRAVERREQLLAKARARLDGDPERTARFDLLYEAAKYNLPVTEDHAFYIDQTGVALFRRFVLEIGRRLVARGSIDAPSDVFLLYRPELVETLVDGGDRRALVAQRRAEMESWASIAPPPVLGTPREEGDDPFMDALTVRLLGITPPEENPDPDVLKGVAGSPGILTGKARVVRSLAEAGALEDGEIMVCEMTLPPWVPLFSVAGAVVTDTGGVLSHCAIVAREYELPAVVGTLFGTSVIQTGMTITVDGNTGRVRIHRDQ